MSIEMGYTAIDPKIPTNNASPSDVRAYLVSILVDKHEVPRDQAQEIAGKWTIGTGRELQSYSSSMFIEIFGPEYGWALYKESYVQRWRSPEEVQKRGWGERVVVSFVIGALCVDSYLIYKAYYDRVGWLVAAIFGSGACIFLGISALVFILTELRGDPEEKAEEALRQAGNKK